MPVLYDYELSADAYKVRLLMSLLGVPYEKRAVDVFPGREHLSPDFLELNPRGTLPVLVDGELVLGDAEAILCHLAASHDASRAWLPAAGAAYAETMAWLFFAARELSVAEAARLESMLQLPAGTAGRRGKSARRIPHPGSNGSRSSPSAGTIFSSASARPSPTSPAFPPSRSPSISA